MNAVNDSLLTRVVPPTKTTVERFERFNGNTVLLG
jgi:hypothetical protein